MTQNRLVLLKRKVLNLVIGTFYVCRKRVRNLQEDEVEFMPLSKRINNLHIRNSLFLDNHPTSVNASEWGPRPPNYSNPLPASPPSSEGSLDWSNIPQYPQEYAPDLNETENPHYFSINKLLFEMYIQRLQRGCQPI